jgi:hypothetical protein
MMFNSIDLKDGKVFIDTVELSLVFQQAVKRDLADRNELDGIRATEQEKAAQRKQINLAAVKLQGMTTASKDQLETEGGIWMAFDEHKNVDLFVRAARRAGYSDENLAFFLPKGLATQDNAALFDKYEMKDLAAVLKTALRPK